MEKAFFLRAQVSLEFLLVLLAFSGAFAALLPSYLNAYSASIFALDSQNAKMFANSIEQGIAELQSLGNGSGKALAAEPSLKWKIFSRKNELLVSVQSEKNGKEKTFKISFPNNLDFAEIEFDSKKNFLLEKSGGKISFKNLD